MPYTEKKTKKQSENDEKPARLKTMRLEKIIMQISALSGLAIGAMEFIMFLLTGSQAILIDGLYDWMGVVIILSYVFIQPLLYRPVSEKTPYGYAQIETVFVLVKCSILICMTVYIIFDNVKILFGSGGGNQVDSGFIARFEFAVFVICLIAWLILRYFSRRIDAPMISAEMMEWRLDVYLTFGSFVGFSVVPLLQRLGIFFIAENIDQIIAVIIALFMVISPIRMFVRAIREIILLAPDSGMVERIKKTAEELAEPYPYEITFFDIVETGRKIWISLYIRSINGVFYIEEIRRFQRELQNELEPEYGDIDIDLIPEIDPEPPEEEKKTENLRTQIESVRQERQKERDR